MLDLSTTYMGLQLRNPLVISSSPLGEDLKRIQDMADAGAAAVVLPSLFEEQVTQARHGRTPDPTGGKGGGAGPGALPNLAGYNFGPEGYLDHIRKAKSTVDIPVIASLNATSPGSWVRYAREVASAGADGIELNIYHLPTSPEQTGATVEQMYADLVQLLKSNVRIPVAVKLSPYFTSLPNFAVRLDEAGADALVLFNRFYQPDFDLDNRTITPTLDLSTPQELRLRLHWVAILHGLTRADLAITGGVHTAADMVKGLMAGAKVAMMASAILENGVGHVIDVLRDLGRWLQDHRIESVREIQGQMSRRAIQNPDVYERVNYMQVLSSYASRHPKGEVRG